MSERAAAFLQAWVRDNLFELRDENDTALQSLLRDAHSLGMGQEEFEEEVGDVGAYLRRAASDPHLADLRRTGQEGTIDT